VIGSRKSRELCELGFQSPPFVRDSLVVERVDLVSEFVSFVDDIDFKFILDPPDRIAPPKTLHLLKRFIKRE